MTGLSGGLDRVCPNGRPLTLARIRTSGTLRTGPSLPTLHAHRLSAIKLTKLSSQCLSGGRHVAANAAGAGTFGEGELPDTAASPSARQPSQAEVAAQLARKRSRALMPYLVPSPNHGIIGSSKYADRLRRQVVAAARDTSRRAVLVFGEPGLEKSNVAALIHFSGPCRITPMAALDCARLDWAGSELFGRGDKAGLVETVGDGTLLLQNVHKLPPVLLPKLVRLCSEGTYRPAASPSQAPCVLTPLDSRDALPDTLPPRRRAQCRIIMTASRQVPQLEKVVTTIKVPPLRLRPADVKDLQRYFLQQLSRRQGGSSTASLRLEVTQGALRQLESYGWPGNIKELALVVERAVLQSGEAAAVEPPGVKLSEEVFWFAKQAKDRFRLNLLVAYPPLRRLLRSRIWPDAINFNFTAYVYPLIVALLLWGPQDRSHNPALAVFWDGWWPLVFLSYPLLGRVWCAVCPFMIYGELVQRWRLALMGTAAGGASSSGSGGSGGGSGMEGGAKAGGLAPNGLLKWPRETAERYGPTFLVSLFAGILVWEEVWDLPHSGWLSGCLLLLITAGAVACSAVFERRLWCRYLCPIGGMNGLMAKLAMTEVRARQGVCSGECNSYPCYRGSNPGPSPFQTGVTSLLPAFATSISTRLQVGIGGSNPSPHDTATTSTTSTSVTSSIIASASASSIPAGKARIPINPSGSSGCSGGKSDGGLPSSGCPLYSHPAQLADNRNCTMCMECLRACPNGSVEVRLRPPGSDLWGAHQASPAEVVLMFMLLGAVYLHHLPDLTSQLGLDPAALRLADVTPQHIAASLALLAAPGAVAWAADAAGRVVAPAAAAAATSGGSARGFLPSLFTQHSRAPDASTTATVTTPAAATTAGARPAPAPVLPAPFLTLSYGYLPLLWAATLAHYLRPLLAEGGQLLPITAAMFGWEHAPLPELAAHPAVITFLQGSLLLFGAATSAALSRKLAAAPWVTFTPQLALIGLFTAEAWSLILPSQ